jgi:hypothetical protein
MKLTESTSTDLLDQIDASGIDQWIDIVAIEPDRVAAECL